VSTETPTHPGAAGGSLFGWAEGGSERERWSLSNPPVPLPERWYALRDDLAWSTSHWAGQVAPQVLGPALENFRRGVGDVIARALWDVQWPDRPRRTLVKVIDLAEQARVAAELAALSPCISLDAATWESGQGHLQVAPVFDLGQAQERPRYLDARPGSDAAQLQLARLLAWATQAREAQARAARARRGTQGQGAPVPEGPAEVTPEVTPEVTLVDAWMIDAVTMHLASRMLATAGIRVGGHLSLLECTQAEPDPPLHACNLGDFLIGSLGGLIVRLPGDAPELARAAYLSPWVDLVARAGLPATSRAHASSELWELNAQFFRATGLRVADVGPACRPLLDIAGWRADQPLEDVCNFSAMLLDE